MQIWLHLTHSILTGSPNLSEVKTKLLNLACKTLHDLALPTFPAPSHTILSQTFLLFLLQPYGLPPCLLWSLLTVLCLCYSLCLDNASRRYCILIHHSSVIREALADFSDWVTLPLIKFSAKYISLKHLEWLQCVCRSPSLDWNILEGRNCVSFCSPLYPEHLEHTHETSDEWMNAFPSGLLSIFIHYYVCRNRNTLYLPFCSFPHVLSSKQTFGGCFYWQNPLFGIFAVSNLLLDFSFGKSTVGLGINSKTESALAAAMVSDLFSRPILAPGNIPGSCRKGSAVVSMWGSDRWASQHCSASVPVRPSWI